VTAGTANGSTAGSKECEAREKRIVTTTPTCRAMQQEHERRLVGVEGLIAVQDTTLQEEQRVRFPPLRSYGAQAESPGGQTRKRRKLHDGRQDLHSAVRVIDHSVSPGLTSSLADRVPQTL
jgi:hypothetical protein